MNRSMAEGEEYHNSDGNSFLSEHKLTMVIMLFRFSGCAITSSFLSLVPCFHTSSCQIAMSGFGGKETPGLNTSSDVIARNLHGAFP